MSRYGYDKDINDVLAAASNEDLDPLVDYILQASISEGLSKTPNFIKHRPNHQRYTNEIAAELRNFGGNTFMNLFRGGNGPEYLDVVRDVAKRLKVSSSMIESCGENIERLETVIFCAVVYETSKKIKDEREREEFLSILTNGRIEDVDTLFKSFRSGDYSGISNEALFCVAICATAIVARTIGFTAATAVAGATLSFGASRFLGVLGGPILWGVMGAITIADIAGPAYRVTIPSVLHVALLRKKQMLESEKQTKILLSYDKPLLGHDSSNNKNALDRR